MPSDELEKSSKHHEDSDSEQEEEVEIVPKVDIDVSKLTPLSPEVISKQVSCGSAFRLYSHSGVYPPPPPGNHKPWYARCTRAQLVIGTRTMFTHNEISLGL